VNVSRVCRMSISGWWFIDSARSATRVTNVMPDGKVGKRYVFVSESPRRDHPGSAPSSR